VIEIDGESHNRGDQPAFDAKRDAWLQSNGLVVERIAAKDVLKDLDSVFRFILVRAHELKAEREAAPRPIPPLEGEVAARSTDGGVSLRQNMSRIAAFRPEAVTPLRPPAGATSPQRGGSPLEHRL
jgi:Protein of unknown function (DUF559)